MGVLCPESMYVTSLCAITVGRPSVENITLYGIFDFSIFFLIGPKIWPGRSVKEVLYIGT